MYSCIKDFKVFNLPGSVPLTLVATVADVDASPANKFDAIIIL